MGESVHQNSENVERINWTSDVFAYVINKKHTFVIIKFHTALNIFSYSNIVI